MRARLGQHFLFSTGDINKIVSALDLSEYCAVIEIGPGNGALTAPIINKISEKYRENALYIGIEKDPLLFDLLKKRFLKDGCNFSFILGDARNELQNVCNEVSKTHKKFVLIGNIPYYITGSLMRLFSSIRFLPERIVLTIQSEVAQRIVSGPPHTNLLGASVQYWANAKLLFSIPKTHFKPAPKVQSSVILLTPKKIYSSLNENYYKTLKILFAHPRKTLVNNLRGLPKKQRNLIDLSIGSLGITNHTRSHELSIETIKKIAEIVYN